MSRVGVSVMYIIFFLMFRRPPRSTRTDTLFPYTTLFRSATASGGRLVVHARGHEVARPQDPPVSGLQLDPGQRFAILAVDHRISGLVRLDACAFAPLPQRHENDVQPLPLCGEDLAAANAVVRVRLDPGIGSAPA